MKKLMKLLPIIIALSGMTKSKDGLMGTVQKLMNVSKLSQVQDEVNEISEMVYSDHLKGEGPTPRDFAFYLRGKRAPASGEVRDMAQDPWGTNYKYLRNSKRYLVRCAGPDKTFNTPDDIYAGRAF